jgi:hypothetical protein
MSSAKPPLRAKALACMLTTLALSSCAHVSSGKDAATWTGSPQAYLEKHLLSRMPWDGAAEATPNGLLFDAHLVGNRAPDLVLPLETMRRLCEAKGAQLINTQGALNSASALARSFPAKERAQVKAAEQAGAFGTFHCVAGQTLKWSGLVEPMFARGPSGREQWTHHFVVKVYAEDTSQLL